MPKIRVLIVDDSVVLRRMISDALGKDPELEVAGLAPHGGIALQKIPQVNPDVVILDVEMPEMDGLTTLREIRKTYPKLPVIMFSTLTAKGAVTTLEALSAGANDYATKPANVGSVTEGFERMEKELIPKIKAWFKSPISAVKPDGPATKSGTSVTAASIARIATRPVEILCLGTSTGGPNALAAIFKQFPANFPVPIVLVQHMPPLFTAYLAERLTAGSSLRVVEGRDGDCILPGQAWLAPGGKHMELYRDGTKTRVKLHEGPPENSCRPAVDVLFRSVADLFGAATLGVVLTGMGQDGMRGCRLIRERGGQVVVQDEASSVVWGMPGSVVQAGVADKIVPLDQVSAEIVRRLKEGRLLRAA